jgi:hypothetical protein
MAIRFRQQLLIRGRAFDSRASSRTTGNASRIAVIAADGVVEWHAIADTTGTGLEAAVPYAEYTETSDLPA